MSNKAFLDVVREVGMEGESPLTVRPWPDDPATCLQVVAASPGAKEFWGNVDITMPRAMAAALGRALIAAAEEVIT